MLTIGVEEEFHLVDPRSRSLVPRSASVLQQVATRAGGPEHELHAALVETATPVCLTLAELRSALRHQRGALLEAAAAAGLHVAGSGTVPLLDLDRQTITPTPRFVQMLDDYQQLAREQLICSCQVHVGVDDRDLAVRAMSRIRPWLPALLALSASSPWWDGLDTGFASYRSEIWARWPTAGMPGRFSGADEYDALIDALMATGVISDPKMAYWDVRPSPTYPTLEVRVADACPTIDESVLQAGLARALVATALADEDGGHEVADVPRELLAAAKWRAARSGTSGALVHPTRGGVAPAVEVIEALLDHARPALVEHGDDEEVERLAHRVLEIGTPAARQRAAFSARGSLLDVVDLVVLETAG